VASTRRSAGPSPEERSSSSGARERILDAAYDLFARHGIRAVGIDRIIAESGVAKMSLYRHFASKDDLVVAFLALREERWTRGWLIHEVEQRATEPRDRLLAIFDALDEWFHRDDFEGCSFINTLIEVHGGQERIYDAAVGHMDVINKTIKGYAKDAGIPSPGLVADQIHILVLGAIVSAGRGDRKAARSARALAALLLPDPA
jgi:AcrR family transcriptional regulator